MAEYPATSKPNVLTWRYFVDSLQYSIFTCHLIMTPIHGLLDKTKSHKMTVGHSKCGIKQIF